MTEPEPDVRAARGGDREALDRVLRAFWPRAFRIAVGVVRDPALAEDAAQDALVLVATGSIGCGIRPPFRRGPGASR